jgi:hypothetical protein
VGFLRRLFGGDDSSGQDAGTEAPSDPAAADEDERAHELELARFEQERTSDLTRRQQRYMDHSWTPPAQGGEERADDGDAGG